MLAASSVQQGPSSAQSDQVLTTRQPAEKWYQYLQECGRISISRSPGRSSTFRPLDWPPGMLGRETLCSNQRNPSVCTTLHFPKHDGIPARVCPTLFFRGYLHVMHIYDAFPTTHRIPTAAGKLGSKGSDPPCLASPSFSLDGGSQESHIVLSSDPSLAPHSLNNTGQAAALF